MSDEFEIVVLNSDESARVLMKDIYYRMGNPSNNPVEVIEELMTMFKRECLLQFIRRFDLTIEYMQISICFLIGGSIVIGLSKESLWSDELIRGLEKFLDITYTGFSEKTRYGGDTVVYEKRFRINNLED